MGKDELLNLLKIDKRIVKDVYDKIEGNVQYVYLTLIQDLSLIKENCGGNSIICWGWKTRILKDKVLTNYKTYIYVKYPRFKILDKGKIVSYIDLITEPKTNISYNLVQKVLMLLKKVNATYTQVAELTNLSPQEVENIFDKYVNCPRGKLPKFLCLDECHNKNQFGEDKYSAILSDFVSHNVVDVVKNRQLKTMTEYFSQIPLKERLNVEFVNMDMWKPYKQITHSFLPNAIIVIDSFHVIQTIKKCIKDLEMKIYYNYDERSKERKLLKKYFNQIIDYKISHQKISFEINKGIRLTTHEIKNEIMQLNKKLADAIKLLDSYKYLNAKCNYKEFDKWFKKLIEENPIYFDECFYDVRTMFSDWYEEIKNSFQVIELKIGKKRLSNGLAESLNNIYKKLMRVSNGVKNFERFRKRLMFCINKNMDYYQPNHGKLL